MHILDQEIIHQVYANLSNLWEIETPFPVFYALLIEFSPDGRKMQATSRSKYIIMDKKHDENWFII
ncbi:MAG TPA: hypothetical protein DEQ17_03345 [Prevotella sp.]|nr:hypothetical protein [Prevotella sp.]